MRDIEELMVEARVVLDRQTELANEWDDEVADYLGEGWEDSASWAKDKADDHWAAASVIRELIDALKPLATPAPSAADSFTPCLQVSLARRGW